MPADVVEKIRERQNRLPKRSTGSARAWPVRMTEPSPDEIAALLQVEHLLDQRWPETSIEPSLTRINALLDMLGSPQRNYPCIHIVLAPTARPRWRA